MSGNHRESVLRRRPELQEWLIGIQHWLRDHNKKHFAACELPEKLYDISLLRLAARAGCIRKVGYYKGYKTPYVWELVGGY